LTRIVQLEYCNSDFHQCCLLEPSKLTCFDVEIERTIDTLALENFPLFDHEDTLVKAQDIWKNTQRDKLL
jgi:hypothetical protein